MASAWAEPFCTGFATTCSKAISLTIRYRVSIRPDFSGNMLMSPIEGEVYLPLTKGIQLSRVLNEIDNPFSVNTNGIYSIQKYYYDLTPTLSKGLRFEAILGNPSGLASMKLQYRFIKGTDANAFLDDTLPPALSSAAWMDVPADQSSTAGIPWTVNLTSAKANQIINFGTQSTASSPGNINRYFKIGALSSDSATEQAKYRWTMNASNELIEPTDFKSGFYQFKVVATDTNGNNIDSMNFVTIRIVPRPQLFLNPLGQPALAQTRNCISAQKNINYSIGLADDEDLGVQTLKLNGNPISFTSVSTNKGFINLPFDLSLAASNYSYVLTAANKFVGMNINNVTITETQGNISVTLTEKPVVVGALSSAPSKIRINNTGVVSTSFEAGSCCQLTPTVSWEYLTIPEGNAPLLSGSNSSTATCTLDSTSNSMLCSTSINAMGIKESPAATSSNDIAATFNFSSGSNACTGGTSTTSYKKSAYIPVVKLPGIQFYTTESLWLTLPSSSSDFPAIKSFTPRVMVRADFDPADEDVTVGIYKSDSTLACPKITFTAGTGSNPIDKPCFIPSGYSGDLIIKKETSNIFIDGNDPADPKYKAKLVSGKLNHRTCQPNLVNEFDPFTVNTAHSMFESPWGLPSPDNDQSWTVGATKNLRCYDRWYGTNVKNGTTAFYNYNNIDTISVVGFGSGIDANVQDPYLLYRYNTESALRPPGALLAHRTLGSTKGGRARFQTYQFPMIAGNVDYDAKNAPYVFFVWNNGSLTSATMENLVPGGSQTTLNPKPLQDFTNTLCTGNASLSTIKLYGLRAYGGSSNGNITYSVNNIYTNFGSSLDSTKPNFYSYHFMCAYGQWNPLSRTNANWNN